jgi:hypothetical protein
MLYLCARFGEKSGLTMHRYYFAFSQEASQTILGIIRHE